MTASKDIDLSRFPDKAMKNDLINVDQLQSCTVLNRSLQCVAPVLKKLDQLTPDDPIERMLVKIVRETYERLRRYTDHSMNVSYEMEYQLPTSSWMQGMYGSNTKSSNHNFVMRLHHGADEGGELAHATELIGFQPASFIEEGIEFFLGDQPIHCDLRYRDVFRETVLQLLAACPAMRFELGLLQTGSHEPEVLIFRMVRKQGPVFFIQTVSPHWMEQKDYEARQELLAMGHEVESVGSFH